CRGSAARRNADVGRRDRGRDRHLHRSSAAGITDPAGIAGRAGPDRGVAVAAEGAVAHLPVGTEGTAMLEIVEEAGSRCGAGARARAGPSREGPGSALQIADVKYPV